VQPGGLGVLLDDAAEDGHELARLLAGIALAVCLALLLAVGLPLALLGRTQPVTPVAEQPVPSTANGRPGLSRAAQPGGAPQQVQSVSDAVAVARRYLGVPYVFGGTNPQTGLDCSGLVQLVFRQLGVGLPRTAQMQYDATPRVGRDQLQPGDLVFFARTYADPHAWITHVGIYVGDGMQINAPTTGQVVSIQPAFSGFWGVHYAGAGRVRGASHFRGASHLNGGFPT
jgi:cell wall-associated NlpC family hydrolase